MSSRPLHIGMDARVLFAREKTGIENYATELVRHLARLPDLPPFTLYTDSTPEPPDAAAAEILASPRLRVRVVLRRRPWLRLWLPLAAWQDRVTVMHFPGTIVSALLPYRAVVTVYDMAALHDPAQAIADEARIVNTVVRRSVQRSARVIAISGTTARDVQRFFGVPPERIMVTPLAPGPHFRPVPDAAEQIAQRFDLPQPYFLFVGTPYPRKNLHGVLRALALLGPGATLAIAGRKAWVDPAIQEAVRSIGVADQVRFLGGVPDEWMPALYSAAHALLHPAFHEGFGLTLVEAMACGTPVITSNTSAMPEVAGDAALLVDPARPDSIAAAARRLLEDDSLRSELAGRGLERARTFSWERTAGLTLEAYRAAHAAPQATGSGSTPPEPPLTPP